MARGLLSFSKSYSEVVKNNIFENTDDGSIYWSDVYLCNQNQYLPVKILWHGVIINRIFR